MDTAPIDHLPPEEVATLRADLHKLAEAFQAQIADILDCLTQIAGGGASQTRH
jgi:hypothetical protein